MQTKEAFQSLEKFRAGLNRVQSLADFVHDVSRELLAYAEELRRTDALAETDDTAEVTAEESVHLRALAVTRKKKRLVFFNGTDGARLRLQVRGHEQKQQREAKYCCLCGNNTGAWRGHRTTFKCSYCDVHLRVRTYRGLRKSCWDVWHSAKDLQPRKTGRPLKSRLEKASPETPSAGPGSRSPRGRRKRQEAREDTSQGSEVEEPPPARRRTRQQQDSANARPTKRLHMLVRSCSRR